jgi:calcium-dependent protein kinase
LVKDPKRRYTASQAYNHAWIKRQVDSESKDILLEPTVFDGIGKIIEAST